MGESESRPEVPLAAVDFMILLALLSGESYGYRIVKEIRDRSDGEIDLLPGNLYAVLQRMERDGLIERSGRRAPGEGGQPRLYYRITSRGRGTAAAEASRMKRLVESADVQGLMEEASP